MAKDLYSEIVKIALEKDGWVITDDPLAIEYGDAAFEIDFGGRIVAGSRTRPATNCR